MTTLRWMVTVLMGGAIGCASAAKSPGAPGAAAERAATPAGAEAIEQGEAPLWRAGPAIVERAPAGAAVDATGQGGEWAVVREFPPPDHGGAVDGLRTDFRDTVYWAPSVVTDEAGTARVRFILSDAITTFRAQAEGIGEPGAGRGQTTIASSLPVAVAVRMPLAISDGDQLRLPVTIANNTDEGMSAEVDGQFGPGLALAAGKLRRRIWIGPGKSRTLYYSLNARGPGLETSVRLSVDAGAWKDDLEKTIAITPRGFPVARSTSGTLVGRREFDVAVPGDATAVAATMRFYPSPVAEMIEGTEALLAQPGGCFEQASSSNYPNVMVLNYLDQHEGVAPEVATRARTMLDRGYALLTGYESDSRGFEWFGADPGHEALSAYGLMQFGDMAHVYPDLDRDMVARTAKWLMSRRDGKGGYQRSSRALDTFGRADEEVTNAYITYSLVQAGQGGLEREVDELRRLTRDSRDPYILSLAAGALLHLDPDDTDGVRALASLFAGQASDGHIGGADHSITRSGGVALDIETTSLAALAMMKARVQDSRALGAAIEWIRAQRSGRGGFSSTQATILALKALTRFAEEARGLPAGARIRVVVNGQLLATVDPTTASNDGAIEVTGLGDALAPGANRIVVIPTRGLEMPFSLGLDYRRTNPSDSPDAAVGITTSLSRVQTRVGRSITLRAVVTNRRADGLPMVIARVGIPGGLEPQTWQLDELVERKVIDFYETREREVTLYWRAMAPRAVKRVDLHLLAAVGGKYTGPPSAAYLYYTDEHRDWSEPVAVNVRPRFSKKNPSSQRRNDRDQKQQ